MTRLLEVPTDKVPAPGSRSLIHHEGGCVVLFNQDGALYALDDACPHNGASLFCGRLQGRLLQCPAHGLRFDLASGRVPGVTGFGATTYALEERQGRLFIDLSRRRAEECLP
ncbi:Rieske (2Fe-2S) protein [Metapseudomonas furukawaii]|jgi:nitrite reductase/ring-hydroxylating ferredoxin subunit|uniref:Ferredoxin reductase n=1 Tax=Metapseudomonas furukawaii TaxID=1149133 RepID=A0AAD1FEP4_METFU|nr:MULTISPECIES: Rieske (2Fe-2S) protein [Pseudomonas]ELS27453.1 Rieske (2Fe-2S) domain containing protein [Pseudomonas furukawaii]OWJ95145.1 Rieske (2Fe-2S) protein [Pseudomonas sp. A46]WAG81312.1 Rieske (2Fe-2S) protein [Pseudomonas furukawaii]BAU74110.1 ferredoxin reductase [Pseudomonas furukawaii]